ncbi:MAG: type II toxin-antitoxin system HipA family toxin, partial [Ruminococcaceae bacterium]|nr:type II toxin-antitoxin system HipA family toxin [Oscillospiraceae bacterium]
LQGSENVEQDRRIFYKSQIVFWLMAAIDGHAKNFSIALLSGGRYQLTPLYDILSAHPYYGNGPNRINWRKSKMAMAVKGKSNHYGIASIQRRHWVEMAKQVGMAHEAELLLEEVADKTADAISHAETLLPANFPEELAQRIFDGMRNQRELLVKQK